MYRYRQFTVSQKLMNLSFKNDDIGYTTRQQDELLPSISSQQTKRSPKHNSHYTGCQRMYQKAFSHSDTFNQEFEHSRKYVDQKIQFLLKQHIEPVKDQVEDLIQKEINRQVYNKQKQANIQQYLKKLHK
ncbi:hypothetical protein SS50377_24680 [Spironucleus salmonicida]|uniref:Uncharacterized protein n=1 Tax=Spironucleus salmonicida TaxID=348837 RepID=V6LUK3_9EUKA|nr:hypothetical protein SS50377_24680 [Spironucleus salmonicida]|eukprot:EST44489.1 Hypothetical protein SS50377_15486 [Spironucleus salmonicida]